MIQELIIRMQHLIDTNNFTNPYYSSKSEEKFDIELKILELKSRLNIS